jgi:hypothetical protein
MTGQESGERHAGLAWKMSTEETLKVATTGFANDIAAPFARMSRML